MYNFCLILPLEEQLLIAVANDLLHSAAVCSISYSGIQ